MRARRLDCLKQAMEELRTFAGALFCRPRPRSPDSCVSQILTANEPDARCRN